MAFPAIPVSRDPILQRSRLRSDPRLLDAPPDSLGQLGLQRQTMSQVDRLPGIARRQDRKQAVPLRGKHQDRVDIGALCQGPESIDGAGPKLDGRPLGPMPHLVAHSADLESVGEGPKRRPMAMLPRLSQADQTDSKFHGLPALRVRGDENGFALYRSASRMPNADSSQLNVTREVVIDAPGWLWPELPRDVPYPLQSMTAKSVKNTYNA